MAQRIAVMCRRAGKGVKDREAYVVMRDHKLLLLHKRRPRDAELRQAAKLFELLPHQPNDLWQMDVTYTHIPGYGWWYTVTVIDYYSRYLLACHLTASYCAVETAHALKLARAEAERIHGPLTKRPFLVTDNRPSFVARRFAAFVRDPALGLAARGRWRSAGACGGVRRRANYSDSALAIVGYRSAGQVGPKD